MFSFGNLQDTLSNFLDDADKSAANSLQTFLVEDENVSDLTDGNTGFDTGQLLLGESHDGNKSSIPNISVTPSAISSNTATVNTLLCASTSDDSVDATVMGAIIPGLSSLTKIDVARSPSSPPYVTDFSVIVSSDTDIPTLAKDSILNSGTVNIDQNTSGYIFNAGSVVHNLFSNSDTTEGADVRPNVITSLQSELDERNREVDSLRTVWNESRQKLSQVQRVSRQLEEQLRIAVSQSEQTLADGLRQTQQQHAEQLTLLQSEHRFSIAGLEQTLEQREMVLQQQRHAIEAARIQSQQHDSDYVALQEALSGLEAERSRLLLSEIDSDSAHANAIRILREEFNRSEQDMDEERRVLSHSRDAFTTRETSLTANNIENSQAFAATHRELTEKTAQLASLQTKWRWLDSDHVSLKNELDKDRATLLAETNLTARLRAEIDRLKTDSHSQEDILRLECVRLNAVVQQHVRDQQQVQKHDVSSDSDIRVALESTCAVNDLEKKLQAMSEHSLQKQTQIERLISEKASVKLMFENSQKRVAEQLVEIARLKDISQHDEPSDDIALTIDDVKTGGLGPNLRPRIVNLGTAASTSRLRMLREAPSVQRAVSLVDSLGAQLVGSGSFARVCVCQRLCDKEVFVMKIMQAGWSHATVAKEVALLSSLDHSNVVRCVDSFVNRKNQFCIVMENCFGGDLSDRLKEMHAAGIVLSEEAALDWMVQLLSALQHCHHHQILHRDIKTQNIYLSGDNQLKLGDFGVGKLLSNKDELASTVLGTPYCLSPEICKSMPYSYKSDIWSLGCVFYEILTLCRPFNGVNILTLVVEICSHPPIPIKDHPNLVYSTELCSLIADDMLAKEPEARLSCDELLKRPLFYNALIRYQQRTVSLVGSTSYHDQDPILSKSLSPSADQRVGLDISSVSLQPISATSPRMSSISTSSHLGDLFCVKPNDVDGVDAKGVAELRMHPLARRGGDLSSGSSSCIGSPIKVALLKRLHQHHHTRATLMIEETQDLYAASHCNTICATSPRSCSSAYQTGSPPSLLLPETLSVPNAASGSSQLSVIGPLTELKLVNESPSLPRHDLQANSYSNQGYSSPPHVSISLRSTGLSRVAIANSHHNAQAGPERSLVGLQIPVLIASPSHHHHSRHRLPSSELTPKSVTDVRVSLSVTNSPYNNQLSTPMSRVSGGIAMSEHGKSLQQYILSSANTPLLSAASYETLQRQHTPRNTVSQPVATLDGGRMHDKATNSKIALLRTTISSPLRPRSNSSTGSSNSALSFAIPDCGATLSIPQSNARRRASAATVSQFSIFDDNLDKMVAEHEAFMKNALLKK